MPEIISDSEEDIEIVEKIQRRLREQLNPFQTWGESTFNDSESDSGRLFDSESDSSQFGYDSEYNSDSSNISISDSESDSNFQLLI